VSALLLLIFACGAQVHAEPVEDDGAETDGAEDATDQLPVASHASGSLLAEAQRELAAKRESHYAHRTHVDEATGAFDYDCSGFVGYALSRSVPTALPRRRPLAKDFVAAMTSAPWTPVARAEDVVAGDVIAWLEPPELHSRNTGHVVIAAAAPRPGARADERIVRVIDSSHSGHGKADTRGSGLGTGEMVLQVDARGAPIGYRWSTWKHSRLLHTTIAIGRLP
jgi:hypothetical protein